jgi:hypothetical protein
MMADFPYGCLDGLSNPDTRDVLKDWHIAHDVPLTFWDPSDDADADADDDADDAAAVVDDEADATAEGMIFTDYGRTVYGTPQLGWSEAPSSRSDQCHGSARAAFGNAFNRRHAGVDWNLRNGPSPWDRNPYVWAYTFKAHTGSTHGA